MVPTLRLRGGSRQIRKIHYGTLVEKEAILEKP